MEGVGRQKIEKFTFFEKFPKCPKWAERMFLWCFVAFWEVLTVRWVSEKVIRRVKGRAGPQPPVMEGAGGRKTFVFQKFPKVSQMATKHVFVMFCGILKGFDGPLGLREGQSEG